MASSEVTVIVGANLTGGRAAEALRQHGYLGAVILVGAEPDRPYERPPLSKDFLRSAIAKEKIYLRPLEWYAKQGIELRLGVRATRLDASNRQVEFETGERLAYSTLLVATGCEVRKLNAPGSDLPGIPSHRARFGASCGADKPRAARRRGRRRIHRVPKLPRLRVQWGVMSPFSRRHLSRSNARSTRRWGRSAQRSTTTTACICGSPVRSANSVATAASRRSSLRTEVPLVATSSWWALA